MGPSEIGVSMVASACSVGFGVLSSGLFFASAVSGASVETANDILTVRIGAVCSLLIAGAGIVTAIGSQLLGAYRLYLQQKEADKAQTGQHKELIERLEASLSSSRTLEEELVTQRAISENIVREMTAQLISMRNVLKEQSIDLTKAVRLEVQKIHAHDKKE